jgi:hypothetical protein
MLLRAAAALLVVFLLALVVMNLLVVSNLGDKVRTLQEDVAALRSGRPAGAPGGEAAFEVETPAFTTGADGAVGAQTVSLGGAAAPRLAVVALTHVIGPDGAATPVHTSPVLVMAGATTDMPLGRDAACLPPPGAAPSWRLSLEGPALRIAPSGCVYPRPTRARLRGFVSP